MIAKTRIVRIGNSRGIRVPKGLLDHARLPEEIELQAEHGRLIVRAARTPRAGWASAAKAMHAAGEDHLLDTSGRTRFDDDEWEWR
jgi:antitoxin MazE